MFEGYTFWIIVGVVGLIVLSGIRIAQEYQRAVIFRLGRFQAIRGPGLYYNIPLFEWQRLLDMRTVTVSVEPQETITKDSVTVKVNAVLWYRVVDPAKAILEVADFRAAVYQVALTSLRNIIGQHVLDEVLKERDKINDKLRLLVDKDTEPWGVMIGVSPPSPQAQTAMAPSPAATPNSPSRGVGILPAGSVGRQDAHPTAGNISLPSPVA